MLSYIDPVLFPDECKILQVSADRYIYPIFKNGSSSLRKSGFKEINPQEFAGLDTVEVFLRDPFDRYVSGVQTFLSHLGPELDRETVLHLIDQYLFLNRHFCLQFHWLVNLARHTPARIHVKSIKELNNDTDYNWNMTVRDQELFDRFDKNSRLKFYLELDRILIDDFMNQTVHFKHIVQHIKHEYPTLYQEVLLRSQTLCSVLD
jgi:hypothetical protein